MDASIGYIDEKAVGTKKPSLLVYTIEVHYSGAKWPAEDAVQLLVSVRRNQRPVHQDDHGWYSEGAIISGTRAFTIRIRFGEYFGALVRIGSTKRTPFKIRRSGTRRKHAIRQMPKCNCSTHGRRTAFFDTVVGR